MNNVVASLKSRCGRFKADIERRSSGAFEVIAYRWVEDWDPVRAILEQYWTEVPGTSSMTDTLDRAEQLAREKLDLLAGAA